MFPHPVDDLKQKINLFSVHRDFQGLGNLMLDILSDADQATKPDSKAELLRDCARRFISRRWGFPETWTYECPFQDRYIAHHDRGNWTKDTYFQLVILAFALGATRRNLPGHLATLLPFFTKLADEQKKLFEAAAQRYAQEHDRALQERLSARTASHVAEEIRRLQHAGVSAEAIAHHVAALVAGDQPSAPAVRGKPITPGVFRQSSP